MQVFQSSDRYTSWDGYYQGKPQEMGTYYYMLQYHSTNNGFQTKKGDVILIR
jgi:hypothetical protein